MTDPKHPPPGPTRGSSTSGTSPPTPRGRLYAATGPTGQLWKRAADGKWSLLLDSKRTHLLSVAVGPDGAVYAGSDGEGLIYRVGPDGKASVVYDAPQSEIRTLQFGPDGALYAGHGRRIRRGERRRLGARSPRACRPASRPPSATSAATEVAADAAQEPPKPEPPRRN